jgi:hypothetical protein
MMGNDGNKRKILELMGARWGNDGKWWEHDDETMIGKWLEHDWNLLGKWWEMMVTRENYGNWWEHDGTVVLNMIWKWTKKLFWLQRKSGCKSVIQWPHRDLAKGSPVKSILWQTRYLYIDDLLKMGLRITIAMFVHSSISLFFGN